MDEDDRPPQPRPPREGAAGAFGQLVGASIWVALFAVLAGARLYIVLRAHG